MRSRRTPNPFSLARPRSINPQRSLPDFPTPQYINMDKAEVSVFKARWLENAGCVGVTGAYSCYDVVHSATRRDAHVEVALRVEGARRRTHAVVFVCRVCPSGLLLRPAT